MFQEKECYILTNLWILNGFLTPNDFFYPKNGLQNIIITKYVCFSDFHEKMKNQENFPNVFDLSFDERFVKYYHISLH